MSVFACMSKLGYDPFAEFVGGSTADVGFGVFTAVGVLAAGDVSN